MLYLYDSAIVEDLKRSFNSYNVDNPVVKVIDPEGIIQLAAQIQNDEITFPIVAVSRDPDTPIDTDRFNYVRAHRGVANVFDTKTNNIYYERMIPIELGYHLTVLTTNTADMDELIKELMFKYLNMYFLTISLPYESKRKMRFGVVCDFEGIERSSSTLEYLESGRLYQSIIPLRCEGAVLLSYTPAHLRRLETEVESAVNS